MKTIEAWEFEDLNNPSRTDHYLMQIAQAVMTSAGQKKRTKLDEFKIRFGSTKKRSMTPEEKAQAVARAKASWRSRRGMR